MERRTVEGEVIRRDQVRSPRLVAELITRRPTRARTHLDLLSRCDMLFLHLRGVSRRGQAMLDGHRVRRIGSAVGRVTLLPAGRRLRGWAEYSTNVSYLAVSLMPSVMAGLGVPALRPGLAVSDPALRAVLLAVADQVERDDQFSAAALDGCATVIAAHLARHYRPVSPSVEPAAADVQPPWLRRVQTLIDGNLGRKLPLAELAAAAGLGRASFAEHFASATGLPPHAYVLERRISRAETLLASGVSVAVVAAQVGFASHSHFSAMFRQRRQVSPRDVRAAALRHATPRQRP